MQNYVLIYYCKNYIMYLVVEIVEIFWHKNVNISHNFQHIKTLQQKINASWLYNPK